MNLTGTDVSMAAPFSPEQSLPAVSRQHPVTEVTPAKKITFFKSGDPQFGGVIFPIVYLYHLALEQSPLLGEHIVYIDLTSFKMEEELVEDQYAAHAQQASKIRKKITLVKNGDPNFRRPIILNRRNVRSFKAFIEDASDLLQYTVRRLYTVDGRRRHGTARHGRTWHGILICVGREPFKPIQIETVRKSTSEKLPGLHSHPSITTEVLDNKKNANFGLKTKKSVIHPRSASSSKTRFSISSDKSYPNGLNMSPVNSGFASFTNECPHMKSEDGAHSLVNDDIEKKVHVNKDGSLSVEMKVRFRLLNEETLQWSTQIKKSSTLGKTKCEQLCLCDDEDCLETKKEMNSEFYSETDDSFYPCDADSYSSKIYDPESKDMYCANCGMQCQDYNIWKNPMHSNQPEEDYIKRRTWQTRSSASSTSSHRNLKKNQKRSINSSHTMSSEEYTERIIQTSSSYSETRENRGTRVTYSAVSQCTSRHSQSVTSNTAVTSENECTHIEEGGNKTCPSLRSSSSLQHQCSEPFYGTANLESQNGSFEDYVETSSRPCSNSEDNCIQRISVISQSTAPHQKCHRRLNKKVSTSAKSLQSSMSCGEESDKNTRSTPIKNIRGISNEKGMNLEDTYDTECADHSMVNGKESNEMFCDGENNEFALKSSRTDVSDYEKSSRASSRMTETSNKKSLQKGRSGQGNEQGSCKSICSSLLSKQNSDILDNASNGLYGGQERLQKASSPTESNANLLTKKRQQTLQSNNSLQTVSSITESNSFHEQDNPSKPCSPEIPRDSQQNQDDCISEEGKVSLPNSRPSSKSQSCSSKCNCISYPENGNLYSMSSRVSTVSEQRSKHSESSGPCNHGSTNVTIEEQIDSNVKPDCHSQNADVSSKASDSEFECTYSPSPPKGCPINRHLRLSKFKHSSGSVSSEQGKTIEKGEKSVSSRSSTPGSKGIEASRASTETCKKIKNSINNSTEEINSKKRKNSSSSSKRKLKSENVDNDNKIHSELIPSALPNVSSEEVVHEWLRKIPSRTMVVDYEVEDCQTKVCQESHCEILNKDQEDVKSYKDLVLETQVCNLAENEGTTSITNISDNNITPDVKNEKKDENEALNEAQTNNIKGSSVPIYSTCDLKTLPSTIHTSVQIMKALLSSSQESKFDRCNSLPEVSPVKGQRLSNSAKVLISCLASLQLLDENPIDPTKKANEVNKPKYTELMNIFQAMWADGLPSKVAADIKPGKIYSREDELTPVSSSGVDVNSGFGGSGDGSIVGGGECPVVAEKAEEGVLIKAAMNTKTTNNITSAAQHADSTVQNTLTKDCEKPACHGEAESLYVDENMNEKKINHRDCLPEEESRSSVVENLTNGSCNNVNGDETVNLEHSICSNDKLNNLSHTEKNPESNESNSQETNCINSPSECQSTVVSSDSIGNSETTIDKQSYEADPVWVLKLLKKIENTFMTHYVDAMNEFKVRWNLEDNDNLDEMIAELKSEVSQRIQRSISSELKKIQTRAGHKVPRPPDESSRRKSSLQAEERRKRLQSMHKRSNGENRENGTNDLSCETDEEDMTFSASFGNDLNGQSNGEEFCPCETCIKKKRILKLEKPKAVIVDAPIIKAFDLQHILKMKKDYNECTNGDTTSPTVEKCKTETDDPGVDEKGCLTHSETEDHPNWAKSGCSIGEDETAGHNGHASETDGNKDSTANNVQGEVDKNIEYTGTDVKHDEDMAEKLEENNNKQLEKSSSSASLSAKMLTLGCSPEHETTDICEENQHDEQEEGSTDINEDPNVDQDPISVVKNEEMKEDSENGDELKTENREGEEPEESYEGDVNCKENDMNEMSSNENIDGEDTELLDANNLDQHSLITQNGSAEDADGDYIGIKNSTGETSPNRDSNSSGSKQCQMYPVSSSEDERGDSECTSPIGNCKNDAMGRMTVNKTGSFKQSERTSRKDSQDETIDQDDFDF
ncbi:retinitis pigmentosa 1-like 1 [Pelobates cultripes]|uniref:Retinitis pigmentosa 1-like 1 n=2 Tax=Pelobates cultripes TaxID=61616 RepID=A0AAD1R955_PELCU|nr:retinitis pigmentosa 1-like 1 [Pelobates cultripes]